MASLGGPGPATAALVLLCVGAAGLGAAALCAAVARARRKGRAAALAAAAAPQAAQPRARTRAPLQRGAALEGEGGWEDGWDNPLHGGRGGGSPQRGARGLESEQQQQLRWSTNPMQPRAGAGERMVWASARPARPAYSF